jgi:hypothetical protein
MNDKKKRIRQYRVDGEVKNVLLAKAKSAISLSVYSDDEKLGSIEIGQGSLMWKAANAKKSVRINWKKFADWANSIGAK